MPIENNRAYMYNHLTPAQIRMNAEKDNMSYQSKGAQSRGSRGLPPINDGSQYMGNQNNYQSYKLGLNGAYQGKGIQRTPNEHIPVAPPVISTHGDARRGLIEKKNSPDWWN